MDKNKPNIKLIIAGCLDHNQASEKRLFELYFGYIKSICLRYGNNIQETDEMLNDTFYTTFKYLDRYDISYDFKPWIRRVCINCCLQYLKKHDFKYDLINLDDLKIADSNTIEIEEVEQSTLLKFIKDLPPSYRTVFNLYVFEEYKHSEIADLLQISVGTSKSNLSKAKMKLESMITNYRLSKNKKDIVHG